MGALKKRGGGGREPPYELWLEVRSVFLDISKAFDKVWHKRPIFKLKKNGWWTFYILSDFLSNRKQRVKFKGQNSSWTNVHVGVPQGPVLDPLLFLIYINDLSNNLTWPPIRNVLLMIHHYFQLFTM